MSIIRDFGYFNDTIISSMSARHWITIITLALLAVVVFFGWNQIMEAWKLLERVNLWIFILILPVQLLSYFMVGEILFSYLRSKGDLRKTTRWQMTRLSLESNFVNHIVPVPGAAGFSYLGWVLRRYGVSVSRSTMAQIIRLIMIFMSFVVLIVISVIALIFDNKANRTTVGVTLIFVIVSVGATSFLIYAINSKSRLIRITEKMTRFINGIICKITRGKKRQAIKPDKVESFFMEMHKDYLSIKRDKKILIKPICWAFITNIMDVLLIFIAFWSLGFIVNPAALFIAFGLSSIVAIFAATPGGTGFYEAIMIAFLASTGVPAEVAIAGTLLARATLLVITILFGYVFYQLTINQYGKVTTD